MKTHKTAIMFFKQKNKKEILNSELQTLFKELTNESFKKAIIVPNIIVLILT